MIAALDLLLPIRGDNWCIYAGGEGGGCGGGGGV